MESQEKHSYNRAVPCKETANTVQKTAGNDNIEFRDGHWRLLRMALFEIKQMLISHLAYPAWLLALLPRVNKRRMKG
jgi:hypothetical protein